MIFVDTSAWIFLFDHRRGGVESKLALEFFQRNTEPLAVTDLTIEETHKWLTHHGFPREKALKILGDFVEHTLAKIITILISKKYLDQGLSYTDAITVAVMKRMKVREIFSFDAHFDLFPGIKRVP